jgi:hypothetical protein
MNDEGALARRPRPQLISPSVSAEAAQLRAGIWAALEAIEAGDYWIAGGILLALVDGGPDLWGAA